MTKPTTDGVVVEHTYSDLEEVSRQNMKKLRRAMSILRRGGESTHAAFDIAAELFEDEAERLLIMGMLRQKNLSEAGLAAERLAAVDRSQIQP